MAAVGNYVQKDQGVSLKEYNDAWRTVRRQAIERSQSLREEMSDSIFGTSVTVAQQQTVDAIQNSSNTSMASAMARINRLI